MQAAVHMAPVVLLSETQVVPHMWKPVLQAGTQAVPLQVTVPFAGGVQVAHDGPQALGLVLGTAVVVYVFGNNLVGGYLALAIPLVLLTLPFVLLTPDHPLEPENRAPLTVRTVLSAQLS